jgi:hypothetical protein
MKKNLVAESKKISLKCTYQGLQHAAQDQHPIRIAWRNLIAHHLNRSEAKTLQKSNHQGNSQLSWKLLYEEDERQEVPSSAGDGYMKNSNVEKSLAQLVSTQRS